MGIIKLNPVNERRWSRFKANKRAKICLAVFIVLIFLVYTAELFVNSKALIVKYNGEYYFPFCSVVKYGVDFGLDYKHEANYRELQKKFKQEGKGNWVLLPIVPYSPSDDDPIDPAPLDEKISKLEAKYTERIQELEKKLDFTKDENFKLLVDEKLKLSKEIGDIERLKYHPLPPDWSRKHYFGTDMNGYDVFSRIVYGFRVAINFALILLIVTYSFGMIVGCLMGYWGGWFDLITQRIIEVFSNIPFIYVAIIAAAIMIEKKIQMGFWPLLAIFAVFGWMGITSYMRTAVYREKEREYIIAAKSLGASGWRIIFNHLLPNVVSLLVTFVPFAVSGTIIGLTSLDFLGYGFPKGDPSWGELIQQGIVDLSSYWVATSVVMSMVIVLFLINSIGEGVREAFDPKKISRYE